MEREADAYVYAIEVLEGALLALEADGVALNEQCDALGYTLISLLTDRYPSEAALLLFETLHSILKSCYEAGPPFSSDSAISASRH